ncbi:MAG: hypothetical protein HYW90_04710 [Candidatus Sungbacteria bacterium]|nr:hypothetical protein [Candidatus Sungbacteria bacterium]
MDNTVGSLTQLQKSLIIGTLLGDGYLRKLKGRKDAFLEINHSIRAKEYVDWKYSVLKNIAGGIPKSRYGNGHRIAYRFYTQQHPELSRMHELFYEGGKKRIPDIQLGPISLAVWFMDDGSRCRDRDVYLNTQQFSHSDQEKLMGMLKVLGLETTINKDKSYYRLRFLKESIKKFNQLISEHIIPSMKYKLSYDPVETWSEVDRSSPEHGELKRQLPLKVG